MQVEPVDVQEQKGLVGKTSVDLVELSNYSVDAEGLRSARLLDEKGGEVFDNVIRQMSLVFRY